MSPAELKATVENRGTETYFFTRQNMKFAGDTMRNYGVRARPVTVRTYCGEEHTCWELYRRRPVKHGLSDSAFFDCEAFNQVFPERTYT